MGNNNQKPSIRFQGFTDAWEQRKLGDFCSVTIGEFVIQTKQDDSYAYPVFNGGRSNTGFYNEFNQTGKKVIISARGANAGFVNRCETPFWAGNSCYSIEVMDSTNWKFLYHVLKNQEQDLIGDQQAANIPSVSKEQVLKTSILMPTVDEQDQLNKLFDNLDNLITLHQRKYDKLVNVKKSMLEKMFPRDGFSIPEIRFAGFTDPWEQRKVGDITNVLSGSRVHKDEWETEGVPFYRSSDVVSAFKGIDNERVFIPQSLYEELIKSSGKLEEGDILITGGGTIGIPYIVPNNEPLYSKDADLIWIKKSNFHDSNYLYTYFTSQGFRDYIGSISHVGTIAHYTIEQVKDTPVLLPNMNEQKALGSFFHSIDHLITLHQRKLEKLKNIKKSMLEKMFV